MKEAYELDWEQKLSSVGLDIKLVNEALGDPDEACLDKIHTLFKNITLSPPLFGQQQLVKIAMPPQSWQIQLLSGKPEYYSEYKAQTDENGDMIGINHLAIYAVLAGKESLKFFLEQFPNLLLNAETLLNASFFSQSIDLLEYILEKNPFVSTMEKHLELFEQRAIHTLILIDWLEGFCWLESKFPSVWHTQITNDEHTYRAIHPVAVLNRMRFIKYLYQASEKHYILHHREENRLTIAHLFAETGFVEGLFFISKNMHYMLQMDDNDQGRNCAHLAAFSGNQEALDFFATPCYAWQLSKKSRVLYIDNYETYDCVHMAWISGNPKQLNRALALSANPKCLEVNLNRFVISQLTLDVLAEDLPKILNKALNDNFFLQNITIIDGGAEWTQELLQEINQKLLRNYLKDFFNTIFVFYQCMKSNDYPKDIFIPFLQNFLNSFRADELNRIQSPHFEKRISICDFVQSFFAQNSINKGKELLKEVEALDVDCRVMG